MTYTEGIDVSHYEPNIDWHKVRMAGKQFMFTKASQGELKDPKLDEHMANAKSEGLPRGVYHFYDPRYQNTNPKEQADKFWSWVENDPGELPLVVDIEAYNKGPWHGWRNWYDFIERLETHTDKEIIIYTGFYFWRDQGGPPPNTPSSDHFKQYGLWIARYGTNVPLIPKPWDNWLFWQYGDAFILDGVTGEIGRPASVDFNYFNGDLAAFNQRFSLDVVPPPPVPASLRNQVLQEGIDALERLKDV